MDCVSFDVGNSREFPVHTHILPRNVWGLENVAHLGKVPPTGATVREADLRDCELQARHPTDRACAQTEYKNGSCEITQ